MQQLDVKVAALTSQVSTYGDGKAPMRENSDLIRELLHHAFSASGSLSASASGSVSLLRKIRDRRNKTQADVARQLALTPQAISSAEANELSGSIQLKSLAKIAEGLGYTLIYSLIPTAAIVEAKGLDVINPDRAGAERAAQRTDNPVVATLVQSIREAEAGLADLDPYVYDAVYRPAKESN